MDITEEGKELEKIFELDWKKTLKLFEKKIPLKQILNYFDLERLLYKNLDKLSNEKFENLLINLLKNELHLFSFSPFLEEFIMLKIDLFNIRNYLKYKYFNYKFLYIKGGNLTFNFFKKFDKESIDYFIENINSKYKNFIEKDIKNFLIYFEKKRDDYLISFLKNSKYFVFGPEIVFSYLQIKDYHYINLYTIYNGLIYNQSTESILRRLRTINE